MKRLISLFGIILLVLLFNMGGCGGSDELNGFEPKIEAIKFFTNADKNPQVTAYTQENDIFVELSISDYDLNVDTIEVQVDQCATASCTTLTPYHTVGPLVISQTDVHFSHTVSGFSKLLPDTLYYIFTAYVTDTNGHVASKTKSVALTTGPRPVIDKMLFYHKTEPAKKLDSWNISDYYSNFCAEIQAHDFDLNASQYYIERKCISTETGIIPSFTPRIGPIQLTEQQTTQNFVINIDTIKDAGNTTSIIKEFYNIEGVFLITIEIEDTLGNTAQISRSITMTR
jgi:hypothetical protein